MLSLEHLAQLVSDHKPLLNRKVREFKVGDRAFNFSQRPYLMGVINLSADSWYRESVSLSEKAAVHRAEVLQAQGADLVDLGAESSLASAKLVAADQQKRILLPLIRELRDRKILVSVETYHLKVATQVLKAGANVLNLTGIQRARDIYRAAADSDAAVIICYVHGKNVRRVKNFDLESDPVELMRKFFEREIQRAEAAGLKKIIIDPGLGFYYRNLQDSAVRVRHQMKIFLNTFRLRSLGYPVCHALPHAFEFFREEVRSAESLFAVLACLGKTSLFRTHEVARVKAVLDTLSCY